MDSDQEDSLQRKFPQMRRVDKAPSLHSINGIGFCIYGKRDLDAETGTYVKTRFICVIFIPFFAIDAWRVADAPDRGWYFIGKEPLSGFARIWNKVLCGILLALVGVGFLAARVSSPKFAAQQELKSATASFQRGNPTEAARIYLRIAKGGYLPSESRAGLKAALESCLESSQPRIVESGLTLLAGLPGFLKEPAPLIPDGYKRGMAAVERFRPADPDAAVDVLDATAKLDAESDLKPMRIDLLKEAIAAKPGNTNRIVQLALVYEADEQLNAAHQLLLPYKDRLGATEGARILGAYFLDQGEHAGAYALLYPYVQSQLNHLHEVERNYTNALHRVSEDALSLLRQGRGGTEFYKAYDKASEDEKGVLVDAFITQRVKQDEGVKRAVEDLRGANRIINVTLELGMVQLNRAQEMTDPAERKTELEAAEKTFLAISGVAGDTDEYRLFLGQVYYWLGRSEEGKELFDQLLEANQRSFQTLMGLASTLRDVGEHSQARELLEEAYKTAKDQRQKHAAASFRSSVWKDLDDQITWLEKSDPTDPNTKINLNSARGDKALKDGDKEAASKYLRAAISGYNDLNRTVATLNNQALVWFSLYHLTGDLKDNDHGLELMQEAAALDPGNSILLGNTLHVLISSAYLDAVGDALRLEALSDFAPSSMLPVKYEDEAGQAALHQQIRENARMKKAMGYLDKVLLLAPKDLDHYTIGLHIHGMFRDEEELQKLRQRFRIAAPDLKEEMAEAQKRFAGEKDKEAVEDLKKQLHRYEALLTHQAVTAHAPTFEYVRAMVGSTRQALALQGEPMDMARLLEESQSIYKAHPCTMNKSWLRQSFYYAIHDELIRSNASYRTLFAQVRHAILPQDLIAFLLDQGGPLAEAVRSNPLLPGALTQERELGRLFPARRDGGNWALFRNLDAAEAAVVADRLKSDSIGLLKAEMALEFEPMSGSAVLELYWRLRARGEEARAVEVYKAGLARGIPLPPL